MNPLRQVGMALVVWLVLVGLFVYQINSFKFVERVNRKGPSGTVWIKPVPGGQDSREFAQGSIAGVGRAGGMSQLADRVEHIVGDEK